ncbi:MAG TPA: AAA family ATPase [Candidatus Paceibacterota bacterium]
MIIGITGTNGAGKGTVVEYLISKGFAHYSARGFITEEIQRRGMPVDRSSMREVANDLRQTHVPSYIVEQLFNAAQAAGGDAIIESIRNVGEAEFLKVHGAMLLAVDADQKLRYERSVARGSETDRVDFDTWVMQEEREWHNAAAHDMNVPGVMQMADATITNNGTLSELHVQVDAILAKHY